MGTCRSSCSHSTDLEYYDAWRKDQPMRGGRRRPTVVMDHALPQRSTRRHTKLWVCDRGCCSIRWKLDYAEFQSYMKYAEISPYVVEQVNHDGCTCVICKGLSDQFLQCRIDQLPTRLRKPTATPSETDDEDDDEDRACDRTPRRVDAEAACRDDTRRPVSSPVA